jgi:hypothetical protein
MRKGVNKMKAMWQYARYALSVLATIAFGANLCRVWDTGRQFVAKSNVRRSMSSPRSR